LRFVLCIDPRRSIRVALSRVRQCPETIPADVYWPGKKPAKKGAKKMTKEANSKEEVVVHVGTKRLHVKETVLNVWEGRLRH
jgi:hypothetical protein